MSGCSLFRGPVQGDAAQNETPRLHLLVSPLAQQQGKFFNRNKTAQRIRYIRVDSRVPVEQDAPERALRVQISEVEAPQQRIRWKKEVQAHEHAAGFGHPIDFL